MPDFVEARTFIFKGIEFGGLDTALSVFLGSLYDDFANEVKEGDWAEDLAEEEEPFIPLRMGGPHESEALGKVTILRADRDTEFGEIIMQGGSRAGKAYPYTVGYDGVAMVALIFDDESSVLWLEDESLLTITVVNMSKEWSAAITKLNNSLSATESFDRQSA